MHKHNPSSSFFYLNNKTFKNYVKELKTLVDLYNCSDTEDKKIVEQMIENLQGELSRKSFAEFARVDCSDDAEWRKGLE